MTSKEQFFAQTMSNAKEIQALTKKVNVELEKINAERHTGMPMREIAIVLVNNGLDPEKIHENVHGDEGRLNVQVGPEIYFTMSWYRMESGRFEIVARASSVHDDYRDPYTAVMNSAQKRTAKNKLNRLLRPVNAERQPTIAAAFGFIQDQIAACGFDWHAFEQATTNVSFRPGQENRKSAIPIGNGIFFTVTWYKDPSQKTWEIVAVAS